MSIEQAAREYIRIRRLRITLRERRNRLHLDCREIDDRPCCCIFDTDDKSEWCPLCIESDVAHRLYLLAAQRQGVALRRLDREVNR